MNDDALLTQIYEHNDNARCRGFVLTKYHVDQWGIVRVDQYTDYVPQLLQEAKKIGVSDFYGSFMSK